jgi:hypothetical protein
MNLQKLGGYAAIANVCGFSILLVFFFLRLQQLGDLEDPATAMTAISSSPVDFYFFYLLLMVCSILSLIPILALSDRMQIHVPNLTRIAVIAASITAAAGIFMAVAKVYSIVNIVPTNDVSAYRAFDAMAQSMWNASGHTSGWVGLLIGWAVLKTHTFPKVPAWLFILAGVFWIRIPIPIELGIAGIIPWVSYLVGLLWFGIALLGQKQPVPGENNIETSK